MPSIQVAKYVREDMHSIKAPIKAGHVFQKLWECSCGSVNKFEENVYLLCLTLQPCTLNLRPRQIHYTAGVWQMKPSLVSPKASQSKTAAFFFWQMRPPLEDRNLCSCQHACSRCMVSWWNSSHASFKKVERILCRAWRTHWLELVRIFLCCLVFCTPFYFRFLSLPLC